MTELSKCHNWRRFRSPTTSRHFLASVALAPTGHVGEILGSKPSKSAADGRATCSCPFEHMRQNGRSSIYKQQEQYLFQSHQIKHITQNTDPSCKSARRESPRGGRATAASTCQARAGHHRRRRDFLRMQEHARASKSHRRI